MATGGYFEGYSRESRDSQGESFYEDLEMEGPIEESFRLFSRPTQNTMRGTMSVRDKKQPEKDPQVMSI